MDRLVQDLRHAVRSLGRSPGLAAVCVLTLAAGIGANTAVFSVVDAALIETPPYEDAGRLVIVWHRMLRIDATRARVPAPDAARYATAPSLTDLAFVRGTREMVLEGLEREDPIRVGIATANLPALLGVDAALGRVFGRDESVIPAAALADTTFTAPPGVILLAHRAWRGRFGADPTVIGRSVRLNGAPVTVVGVLPPDFDLSLPPDLGVRLDVDAWVPLRQPLDAFQRPEGLRDQDSDNTGVVIARLAVDADLRQAREDLAAVATRLRVDVPAYAAADLRVETEALRREAARHARPALVALVAAVLLVLLIACLNVANLLVARAADRRDEMAVRSALGAGRGRIARQVLTEAGLLAAAGTVVGILLAYWVVELLVRWSPADMPLGTRADLDGGVLLFTAATACFATLVFGTAPALVAGRDTASALRAPGARGGGRSARVRDVLVLAQVAISFALLASAGLVLRSFANLAEVHPGFDPRGLLTVRVDLPRGSVGGPARRAELLDAFERRIRELPGVTAVGLVAGLPLGGEVFTQPYGPGSTPESEWARDEANFRPVTAGYFEAMGTRILAGRAFTTAENLTERERVAIVDATLAARLGGNVVGRTLGFPLDGRPIRATIVGVVENVRFEDLRDEGRETIYVPYRQEASHSVSLAVRTVGDPEALVEPIRELGARLATDVPVPVYDFTRMEAHVSRALAPTRYVLAVVAGFSLLALALAAVGIGGLVAYTVRARTREIGIRLALGERAAGVLKRIVSRGIALGAAGILAGALLAAATSSVLAGVLFGVGRLDPLTYIGVAGLLVGVSIGASWWPARRASRIDPLVALRHD